ncbi:DUF3265 domain-containing protein [Vibrio vulnificus]|nr:DUF3265 domain-containing protein [Vibrio vulnificus]
MLYFLVQKAHRFGEWHNKRFKRDSQRVAFLLCVVFCDYDVMRKVSRSVVCPLSGRYV